MDGTNHGTSPESQGGKPLPLKRLRIRKQSKAIRRLWGIPCFRILQALICANALAAVLLAVSFQASEGGFRVVSRPDEFNTRFGTFGNVNICVGPYIALQIDKSGNVNLPGTACPQGAKEAAVVTVDYPLLYKSALALLAFSTFFQAFFVRPD